MVVEVEFGIAYRWHVPCAGRPARACSDALSSCETLSIVSVVFVEDRVADTHFIWAVKDRRREQST